MGRRRKKQERGLIIGSITLLCKFYYYIAVFSIQSIFFLLNYCAKQCKQLAASQRSMTQQRRAQASRYIKTSVKAYVIQRDGERCVACGSCESLEFDHAVPFSRGGSNGKDNIQLLCKACNLAKFTEVWRGPTL